MSYKTVCIDFDGVIAHAHGDGWEVGVFGEPINGVQKSLQFFRDIGWKIIIHTVRGEVEFLKSYLQKYGIPFDHINFNPENEPNMNPGKPLADIYIDDRAICFMGEWNNQFVEKVLNFKKWYDKTK